MKLRRLLLIAILPLSSVHYGLSQCSTIDFILPVTACSNENISITHSLSPGSYNWDFCSGDLNNTPTAQALSKLSSATGRPGMELVNDGNQWFGFVTGTFTNTLYQLEFANGVINEPTTITNLGSLNGKLNNPGQIRIISESGLWYGIIHNTASGELLKLSFGNKLSNTASVSTLITGIGTLNGGFALGKDPLHGWICVISDADNKISLVRLGNNLLPPQSSDIITTPQITNPNNLGDIDLVEVCGNWYGFANNFGNGNVYRMKFGSDLFSIPQIDQITTLPISNGARQRIAREGEDFYLMLASLDGVFFKLQFGSDLESAPVIVNEGNIQNILKPNIYGLSVVKENSSWSILTISQSDGQLYRITYPQICSSSLQASFDPLPVIKYSAGGTSNVSLEYSSTSGRIVKSKQINISPTPSPDINFSHENRCVNSDVNFTAINTSGGIATYDWSFGDTQSSALANPNHQYAASGNYVVELEVIGSNSCKNAIRKDIKIYDKPLPAFTLPPNPLCTNKQLNFINNTSDHFDGSLTYQWYVDNNPVSTSRDLQHAFLSTGVKNIKLQTAIPGCSSELVQSTSNVQAGPVIDFSFLGKCVNSDINFTSNISETVTSQSWNFNDGGTSAEVNPKHTYLSSGQYSVSLSAVSPNGCNNIKTKTVPIYSQPIVNFVTDAPPFSCSGSETPFTNTTPNPSDGVVSAWLWNFGDTNNNSSTLKNPKHTFATAGTYNVKLTATTTEGCVGALQKAIIIAQSPTVNIANSLACNALPVNFSTTGTAISSYYWEIGTFYYSVSNPTHTFNAPGNYPVKLTARAANNCESVQTKNIIIPIPLQPDFNVAKNCVGHQAVFTDVTTGTDAVAQRSWDFAGLGTATISPTTFTYNTLGNKSVKLTVTGNSGCSYSRTKTIVVIPAPVADFTMTPETGAAPLDVQFTNKSTGTTQYVWKFGDHTSDSPDTSPMHTFLNVGDYVTELIASNNEGCESRSTKSIKVVQPSPDVDLKIITITENLDGTMQVIITVQNKGNTFIRNLPVNIDISGYVALRETIEETIAPSSLYNLVLSYSLNQSNGLKFLCADAVLDNDLAPEGNRICTELNDKVFLFTPYPNPVSRQLTIEWIAPQEQIIDVALTDAFGKKILATSHPSTQGLNQAVYNVSKLQNGVYFLIFKSGTISKTQRIFVSNQN